MGEIDGWNLIWYCEGLSRHKLFAWGFSFNRFFDSTLIHKIIHSTCSLMGAFQIPTTLARMPEQQSHAWHQKFLTICMGKLLTPMHRGCVSNTYNFFTFLRQ
jgi:hypothetical protein